MLKLQQRNRIALKVIHGLLWLYLLRPSLISESVILACSFGLLVATGSSLGLLSSAILAIFSLTSSVFCA